MADFGTDVSAYPDLDPYFRLRSGREVLREAIVRRLLTSPGTLHFHPDYGLNLRAYINETMTELGLYLLESAVLAQVTADERVLNAAVRVTFDPSTSVLKVQVELQDAAGPFALTLQVSNLSVSLLDA